MPSTRTHTPPDRGHKHVTVGDGPALRWVMPAPQAPSMRMVPRHAARSNPVFRRTATQRVHIARSRATHVRRAAPGAPPVGNLTPAEGNTEMADRNTVVRSLHDLGLAAWFGGSLAGAIGLNGAGAAVLDDKERARVASAGWKKWTPVNAAAIGAHLAGAGALLFANKGRVAGQQG